MELENTKWMNGQVKIFGERNSGTNLLSQIVQSHSRMSVSPGIARDISWFWGVVAETQRLPFVSSYLVERGLDYAFSGVEPIRAWKHCATWFDYGDFPKQTVIIILVRHPISWAYSLFQNPHNLSHSSKNFEGFVNTQFKWHQRDRLRGRESTVLDMYLEKLTSYRALLGSVTTDTTGVVYLRFEDLVTSQSEVIAKLANTLGFDPDQYSPIDRSTKNKTKTRADYVDYYSKETWRDLVGSVKLSDFHELAEAARWFGYE